MNVHRRKWGAVMCVVFGVLTGGCSTQARWVNCEGRLEPINRPAPKSKEALQRASPSPPAMERGRK